MDKKTRNALRGSIAKWQAIVDGDGTDEGWRNCPLCIKFYNKGCKGCPVAENTGRQHCSESPYDAWSHIKYSARISLTSDGANSLPLGPIGTDETIERVRAAAQKELDFLISLLPAD
jgi:hypothetical protein